MLFSTTLTQTCSSGCQVIDQTSLYPERVHLLALLGAVTKLLMIQTWFDFMYTYVVRLPVPTCTTETLPPPTHTHTYTRTLIRH